MGKKLFLLLLALLLVLSMTACSSTNEQPGTTEPGESTETTEPEESTESTGSTESGSVETVVPGKFTVGFDQNFLLWGLSGMTGSLPDLTWS